MPADWSANPGRGFPQQLLITGNFIHNRRETWEARRCAVGPDRAYWFEVFEGEPSVWLLQKQSKRLTLFRTNIR